MKKFKLIAFDIDGTLTQSKLPLDVEMAGLLCRLMEKYKVAIISGASYGQFQWQILDPLACRPEIMKNLYLLPVDGTVFCYGRDGWQCQNDAPLSPEERKRIQAAFGNIFEESGFVKPDKIYGELVEDRGAQFNFSALGQEAPIVLKEKWDPDNKKRKRMVEILKRTLPDFSIRIGGTTSIEVTKAGIDKAYGLSRLIEKTSIPKERILYIGDKLFKGGNDEPALTLGIESRAVENPEETKKVILEMLE
ncbi:MAG: HAD-superfamily hydrolase, subfamily IIB [Parcubacteria group bacterium GW2011_GWA2_45_15]|nr:MAG: HAD-superfamily hydrolase, subfamily IIB [Parcubacteria group bacterium GW2011_GWA2_45_15]